MPATDEVKLDDALKLGSLTKKIKGHQGMVIGSVIVFTVIAIALLAPLLAPHDPYQQDLMKRLLPQFGIVVAAGSIFSALITLVVTICPV